MILLVLQDIPKSSPNQWLFFLLLFVIFYLFMIRPQIKKQKRELNYRNELKKGDRVVTSGGIYGKIQDIKSDSFIISIDNNVKVQVQKSSISMEMSKSLNKG